jgi:uncharacterized protein (DUF58 family)
LSESARLRAGAETLAAPYPALLAEARHLASGILLGAHGRRRAGTGSEFWQYRAAQAGDVARSIDWRRSARSDAAFVREHEWQSAQSVVFSVDRGASMGFASAPGLPAKADRAALLALAASVLLVEGGERVGLADLGAPPRTGRMQLARMADALSGPVQGADYAPPQLRALPPRATVVFLSDFLGPLDPLQAALAEAANRGLRAVLIQVLDPQEEAFPFTGRTIFESMGGGLKHETLRAGDLRDRYLDRLAARKAELAGLALRNGWTFATHHTDGSAAAGLMWLYQALKGEG